MNKFILAGLFLFQCVFSAEPKISAKPNISGTSNVSKQNIGDKSLGRVGDYGLLGNPQYDRAKGYLLKGKIKNAVSNGGNFITWDYHPAGFWGEYGYLPHVGFVAGVPGHEYSSHWSQPGNPSWIKDNRINSLWFSEEAYDAWVDGIDDPENDEGNYKTIVYNTVVEDATGDKGHNDRGDIALEIIDYCSEVITDNDAPDSSACLSAGYDWIEAGIGQIDPDKGMQWFLDHEDGKVYMYLKDTGLDPNNANSGIGLAFPWSIRPKFKSRTKIPGGLYRDMYDYGDDMEEWTEDDNYEYFGATFDESWFVRDGGAGPAVKTDWQATTDSRYNTHNLENKAGDLFGDTDFTDPNDPYSLLAHSGYPATWPTKYSIETQSNISFWPGWWADEYYGDSPDKWSTVGIYECNGTRADDGCWRPLPNRHISDMDVYMEFDDRWASVGNEVLDNEYVSAGYPMGLKVMSMAHSYGVAYAEDVMFVTVNVRNESGDYCAFEKDSDGLDNYIKDEDGFVVCDDAMIMPDGTKLNRGKGFVYKKLYLGFYMDADVLSTDATGGYSVHTNADDFMKYIDCKISKDEYPEGCPVVNNDTLRISMALIGDYDGRSGATEGYSMNTGNDVGSDFGVVAVQLLDSPYSTGYVDLDQDGFFDIYPGEKLKMTDWHWFDWYNRPGVLSGNQVSDTPALNKELIQYQVIAGDNTNLTVPEKGRYFHSANPETDYDTEINPHFDNLDGLRETDFFINGDAPKDGLDCVLEMSTGPFDLEIGEQVSFSFSIIFGQNIDDLLKNAKFAQIMYNSHYQGYTPPVTPNVMAVSGHNKVELYWDDISVESRDVITNYSDFEGYKIYRSSDGGATWGSPDEEILIENTSQGWQPMGIGCIDNPEEDGGERCSNKNYFTECTCESAGFEWSVTPFNHGSDCSSFRSKIDCLYSDPNSSKRRDKGGKIGVDDCFWKVAQFDLSAEVDSAFCILGRDQLDDCILRDDCPGDCVRGVDVQGPDPQMKWLSLGYNTSFDVILLDPCNPDSVLTIQDEDTNELTTYKYKFVDHNVTDGMEYAYSVVAYDRGVPKKLIDYNASDSTSVNGDPLFTKEITSIPDPSGWGTINPFQILESPKGTTVHDPNFVLVVPGYKPQDNLDHITVAPNPYIVHSDFENNEYKKQVRFTRLPQECTITIFTISGETVRKLEHDNSEDGNALWDLRSYNNQEVAPGLYIYVVETPSGNKKIGKFAIVR